MLDTNSSIAIKTEGLGMIYSPGLFQKKKVGLSELDLDVPRGSIFGYLGQNGAGKTTTIKILTGLQFATSGRASIFGGDVLASATRRAIGFMPENPYFYEYLNAEESLDFYGKLSGMDTPERKKRTDELLVEFSLNHARNVKMRFYSKGMRQRLGLAQAMMAKPPLVILDEPMSGLDPMGRRDVRNAILRMRDAGQTVFFSSHILSDVEEICDRVCVLNQGRKVAEGPIASLLTNKVIEVSLSFSGVAADKTPDLAKQTIRTWHDGTLFHIIVDTEERAAQVRAELERSGATLRSLAPHKESLEEYFVRVTAGSGGAGPEYATKPTD